MARQSDDAVDHKNGVLPAVLFFLLLAGLWLAAGSVLAANRDLTVTLAAPATATDNTTVEVNVTVTNWGDASAGPVELQLFLDGAPNGTLMNYGQVSALENVTRFVNLTMLCGMHWVNATVDPSDSVPENNETNNTYALALRVVPFVDFTSVLSGPLGALDLVLDASASHGCEPLNYTWTAGGITKYGANVTYSPPAGNLTVALTVTPPDASFTTNVSRVVSVPNLGPSVTVTLPAASVPTLAAAVVTVTATDDDGAVASYLVDFGDGNSTTALADIPTYAYHRAGNFTITVTVTDNLGAANQTTLQIVVTNRAPTIATNLPYWIANPGDNISFDASGSSDPEGGALTFAWDFGDGSTGTGPTAHHAYAAPGTYHVNLTVTDADGTATTKTMDVTILGTSGDSGSMLIWGFIILVPLLLLLLLLLLLRRRKREPEPTEPAQGASEGISGKPPSP